MHPHSFDRLRVGQPSGICKAPSEALRIMSSSADAGTNGPVASAGAAPAPANAELAIPLPVLRTCEGDASALTAPEALHCIDRVDPHTPLVLVLNTLPRMEHGGDADRACDACMMLCEPWPLVPAASAGTAGFWPEKEWAPCGDPRTWKLRQSQSRMTDRSARFGAICRGSMGALLTGSACACRPDSHVTIACMHHETNLADGRHCLKRTKTCQQRVRRCLWYAVLWLCRRRSQLRAVLQCLVGLACMYLKGCRTSLS